MFIRQKLSSTVHLDSNGSRGNIPDKKSCPLMGPAFVFCAALGSRRHCACMGVLDVDFPAQDPRHPERKALKI
jgi:hypothetical protein